MRILVNSGETLYFVKDSRRVDESLVVACCVVCVVRGDRYVAVVPWLVWLSMAGCKVAEGPVRTGVVLAILGRLKFPGLGLK